MERYLNDDQLPTANENGKKINPAEAKRQRRFEMQSDAYPIYRSETETEAQEALRQFVSKWEEVEPKAIHACQKDIELTLTFYQFDESLHRHIRTTNRLERLFREFRTKSDEIGALPYEVSCLTVFFLVIERDHAKHNRKSVAKNS
jgi:putative transposase